MRRIRSLILETVPVPAQPNHNKYMPYFFAYATPARVVLTLQNMRGLGEVRKKKPTSRRRLLAFTLGVQFISFSVMSVRCRTSEIYLKSVNALHEESFHIVSLRLNMTLVSFLVVFLLFESLHVLLLVELLRRNSAFIDFLDASIIIAVLATIVKKEEGRDQRQRSKKGHKGGDDDCGIKFGVADAARFLIRATRRIFFLNGAHRFGTALERFAAEVGSDDTGFA